MVMIFTEEEMLESALKKRDRLQYQVNTETEKFQKKIAPLKAELEKAQSVVDIYAPRAEDGASPLPIPYRTPDEWKAKKEGKEDAPPAADESAATDDRAPLPAAVQAGGATVIDQGAPATLEAAAADPLKEFYKNVNDKLGS